MLILLLTFWIGQQRNIMPFSQVSSLPLVLLFWIQESTTRTQIENWEQEQTFERNEFLMMILLKL